MRRRLLRRPSPSFALAVVALFVALGGTTMARVIITGSEIKNGSLTGSDIKNHSLTGVKIQNGSLTGSQLKHDSLGGTQIKESSLGKVPSAANADHATSANTATTATTATNATNATNVDGMSLDSFSFTGTAQQTVLNDFDGLSLTASCVLGDNNGLTVQAFSGVPNAEISYSGITRGGPPGGKSTNDATEISGTPQTILSPAGGVDTANSAAGVGFTVGQIVYSNSAGNLVTVDYRFNAIAATCQFDGTVVGKP